MPDIRGCFGTQGRKICALCRDADALARPAQVGGFEWARSDAVGSDSDILTSLANMEGGNGGVGLEDIPRKMNISQACGDNRFSDGASIVGQSVGFHEYRVATLCDGFPEDQPGAAVFRDGISAQDVVRVAFPDGNSVRVVVPNGVIFAERVGGAQTVENSMAAIISDRVVAENIADRPTAGVDSSPMVIVNPAADHPYIRALLETDPVTIVGGDFQILERDPMSS